MKRLINAITKSKCKLNTPYFVFDDLIIENNFKILESILKPVKQKFEIAYSLKTNPSKKVAMKIKELTEFIEVVTKEELEMAIGIGFKNIIFNGIYKKKDEIIYAAKENAIINIDGIPQLDSVCKISEEYKGNISIGIRLSVFPFIKDDNARFGINFDESEFELINMRLNTLKNINLCCLHIHLGTNIHNPKLYGKALKMISNVKFLLEQTGSYIKYIDIGGGIPNVNTIKNQWSRHFCDEIIKFYKNDRNQNATIIIEPGRALVESSGFIVTSIVDIRRHYLGKWEDVIVDVGTNSLIGAKFGVKHECIPLNNSLNRNKFTDSKYRIVGPLCCADDVIVDNLILSNLTIGDKLIIINTGAYDFSTSYSFNLKVPQIVHLTKDGNFQVIR